MFMMVYVVWYNINLYQLHENIKKIVIIVLICLIGFKKKLHIKIVRKGFKYMGFIKVMYGGYKKVIKRLMYFSPLTK